MHFRKIVWIALMGLMLACSSGTDSGTNGGVSGTTVAMKDYVAKRDRAQCEWTQRCAKETKNGQGFTSLEACLQGTKVDTGTVDLPFADEIKLTNADKVSYDAKQAAICIKALREMPCAVGLAGEAAAERAACGHVFRGKTAPDGACEDRLECKDGWCKRTEGKEACPGVCSPDAVEGEKCEKNSWCLGHLYCQNAVCGSFVPAKKDANCLHDSECAAGLECPLASLTCQPTLAKGATCKWGVAPSCNKDLFCTEGVCSAPRGVGEACTNIYGYPRCLPHLHCIGEDGKKTCVVAKDIGADCKESAECGGLDGYCGGGKCKQEPGLGQPCAFDGPDPKNGHCLGLALCAADGTCAEAKLSDLGEACSPDDDDCRDPYLCDADKKVCVEVAPPSDCN